MSSPGLENMELGFRFSVVQVPTSSIKKYKMRVVEPWSTFRKVHMEFLGPLRASVALFKYFKMNSGKKDPKYKMSREFRFWLTFMGKISEIRAVRPKM